MFACLGKFVSRAWPALLIAWIVLLAVVVCTAPPWDRVVRHGENQYLPPSAPSRRAETLFDQAFPGQRWPSRVVVVVHRENGPLNQNDKQFIVQTLRPRIEQAEPAAADRAILGLHTFDDSAGGVLLNSVDGKASLVLVDLAHDYLDPINWPIVNSIEKSIDEIRRSQLPAGLSVDITGSAVVGRDVGRAEGRSATFTQRWTITIVVALLLVIYRAPLLVLLLLVNVGLAVECALKGLQLLAAAGWIDLFEGVQIYVIVLGYGAGVDYCLFLAARYREELRQGAGASEAGARALAKAGPALGASAATVIGGIGMMSFASFHMLHQAGIAIPISLLIVLAAALTFAPSLLCLAGRFAFWPRLESRRGATEPSGTSAVGQPRLDPFRGVWHWLGSALERRPALIWTGCVIFLAPWAVVAALEFSHRDYGVIANVPPGSPTVAATNVLHEHYPAGMMAAVTVLLQNDQVDFGDLKAVRPLIELTDNLANRRDELKLADIRSLGAPLGTVKRKDTLFLSFLSAEVQDRVREESLRHYVSNDASLDGHVTRLDLVLSDNPLATPAILRLDALEQGVRDALPEQLRSSRIFLVGTTAGLHDLMTVTSGDQRLIGILTPAAVLVVLLAVLRRLVVSVYLVLSVIFSYLTTLGITTTVFWALDPQGFVGLDWRTPLFLFTILVAVGEDYNIFLMTRIHEEQERHGRLAGIIAGLNKTGGIISSCGLIMAGTFASLMAGALPELKQMGFALALGVLLDTMVVRPILVPSFLILFERFQLLRYGRNAITTNPRKVNKPAMPSHSE